MADEKITMLDVIKRRNTDQVVGLIDDAAGFYPEFRMGFARTIRGTSYKTLVRTSLPAGAFRAANEGVDRQKAEYINRLVECFIFDASWDADKAVADADEDGPDAFCALQASDRMEGAIRSVCQQFYYGASSGVPGADKGFQGLRDFVDSVMLTNATGTGSTTSSVYALRFGIKDVAFVLGGDGRIEDGEITVQQVLDANNKKYPAYTQPITGWIGLQVGSKFSVGRLKNVSASETGKTLDDDMLADLLTKFPTGRAPEVFLMSRRSLEQLRKSRTATNATGAPAPTPAEAFGVPIVATDAILDTEVAA